MAILRPCPASDRRATPALRDFSSRLTRAEDVDGLLKLAEAVMDDDKFEGDVASMSTSAWQAAEADMAIRIEGHAQALEHRCITLNRFKEVVVIPFFKLALKRNQVALQATSLPSGLAKLQQQRVDSLFRIWRQALLMSFDGSSDDQAMQGVFRVTLWIGAARRAELVQAFVDEKLFQVLVNLLEAPTPKVAFGVLGVMCSALHLPPEHDAPLHAFPLLLNKRICMRVLKDTHVMTGLLTCAIVNAAKDPVADMEWVAVRAQIVVKEVFNCTKTQLFSTKVLPFGEGGLKRVVFELDAEGLPKIVVSSDLGEKLQAFLDFVAADRADPATEAKQHALTVVMDRVEDIACPIIHSIAPQHRIAYSSARANTESCAACGMSGAGVKLLKCMRCRKVWYCSKECQTADWKSSHKRVCQPVA